MDILGNVLTVLAFVVGVAVTIFMLVWIRALHVHLTLRNRSKKLARLSAEVAALRQHREYSARLIAELRNGTAFAEEN